ncbi:MAG: NUDIX hydrolase [Waddliaceae bacterium]|jgi:ADP-ribose pyrophosphatase|nr:NUDIX hydrolase [Waddliaceae bacterium]MBT3579220.1 NUDIX hydrolase [Waddliaceae bacterium]MBT4444280.1 NUDIX hydrolase [Waddliaceae bacterium]MBT6928919.1 NUDIX hydrolase [Waddliaceae bacterium]MBT7264166.1 NUDIX hydrolase [Waddliaceae bacterium]
MKAEDFIMLAQKKILETKVFNVAEYSVLQPGDVTVTRTIVEHRGSVVFMPITAEGKLIITKQYRAGVDDIVLEFPAGTMDKEGESPLDCAKREICEEVGYEAKKWTSLGYHFPSPGYCNHKEYDFIAEELSPKKLEGPEEEIIEVVIMSPEEFESAIKEGVVVDGKSLSLYLKAKIMGFL